MRAEYRIHANALRFPLQRKNVLITAQSQDGKSTITGYAHEHGAKILSAEYGVGIDMRSGPMVTMNHTHHHVGRLEAIAKERSASRWGTEEKMTLDPTITEEEELHHFVVLRRDRRPHGEPRIEEITSGGAFSEAMLDNRNQDIEYVEKRGSASPTEVAEIFERCRAKGVKFHLLTVPELEEGAERRLHFLRALDALAAELK